MRDGGTGNVAVSGGGLAAVQPEAPAPLGWDGIGAIVILLVAAADPHPWVSDASIGLFALRVFWGLIYLAAVTRLVQHCGTQWLTWTVRHQPALCVLLTLTLASSLWSLTPWFTLHKTAALLGTTLLGVFIGYVCRPQTVLRVLQWAFTALIVLSIVVASVGPAPVAQELPPEGWSGIMVHKNSFGAVAVFATTLFLIITFGRRVHPIWGAILSILSLLTVAYTRSRTSFVALTVSLGASAYLAVAGIMRRPTRAVMQRVALGLVCCVSVLPLLVVLLATLLGDETLLNGRARLWTGVVAILRERPATGYGYATVWGRTEATLLPHIAVTKRLGATNAHNSVLDVASELGIPGGIVACLYLFGALANAGRLYEREASTFSFFALVFLIAFTVLSIGEAHLLRIHSIFWIVFVAVTVGVKRVLTRDDADL